MCSLSFILPFINKSNKIGLLMSNYTVTETKKRLKRQEKLVILRKITEITRFREIQETIFFA